MTSIVGKTFRVIEQDASGLVLADESNGWNGIGAASLVKVVAEPRDEQWADIKVVPLKEGK